MVREDPGVGEKWKVRERKVTKGLGVGQVRVYGEIRDRNSESRVTTTSKNWKRITENTKELGQRMLKAPEGGKELGLGRIGQEKEEDRKKNWSQDK